MPWAEAAAEVAGEGGGALVGAVEEEVTAGEEVTAAERVTEAESLAAPAQRHEVEKSGRVFKPSQTEAGVG